MDKMKQFYADRKKEIQIAAAFGAGVLVATTAVIVTRETVHVVSGNAYEDDESGKIKFDIRLSNGTTNTMIQHTPAQ